MPILKTIWFKCRFILLLSSSLFVLSAQQSSLEEYQIKAAFLFNFAQFTEWPESAFSGRNEPLIIGIVGPDPFKSYLDEIVSGENVQGHPLIVKRFVGVKEVKAHILFVSVEGENELKGVIESLQGLSILTVSDKANFIEQGGMVRFVTINKKIRFQVNPLALKKANLAISSKVLRLAEIVSPREKR